MRKTIVVGLCLLAAFISQAQAQFGPTISPTNVVAGQTQTTGITSGDLIGSTGNLAVDSGVAWVNVGLLNGTNTWTAVNTFNANAAFLGLTTFQNGCLDIIGVGSFAAFTCFQSALVGGTPNTAIVPSYTGSDTFAMLGQNNTFTGTTIIKGVTTNSNAAAGNVGEFTNSQCPGPTTTATVTITIATPGVITWAGHPFLGTAPRFDVCPVVFTNAGGALPTGITTGTTYWVAPASISGNTFSISTTVANAIANTLITTSGSQSGTQTGTAGTSSATGARDMTGLPLTAGDWDCNGALARGLSGSTSITSLKSSISQASVTDGTIPAGTMIQLSTAANVEGADTNVSIGPVRESLSGTTNVFMVADDTFTASTNKAYGTLRCRRVR